VSKASKSKVCNLFYGYSVDEIMRVCCVSEATARHYKRGTRLPSSQGQRLWWLHIQGRLLGRHWKFLRAHEDCLVDDAGNRFSEGEIRTLPFLHQKISMLERKLELFETNMGTPLRDIRELEQTLSNAARAIDFARSVAEGMQSARRFAPDRPPITPTKRKDFQ
jgi:hypothetical protein